MTTHYTPPPAARQRTVPRLTTIYISPSGMNVKIHATMHSNFNYPQNREG